MLPVILAALGALFLLAPVLVVVPMSFSTAISFAFPPPGYWLGYYAKYFTSEEWLEPTLNSFVIALGAMTLTMLLVVPAAFGYVRYRFRGKSLVNLLIMSSSRFRARTGSSGTRRCATSADGRCSCSCGRARVSEVGIGTRIR